MLEICNNATHTWRLSRLACASMLSMKVESVFGSQRANAARAPSASPMCSLNLASNKWTSGTFCTIWSNQKSNPQKRRQKFFILQGRKKKGNIVFTYPSCEEVEIRKYTLKVLEMKVREIWINIRKLVFHILWLTEMECYKNILGWVNWWIIYDKKL